MLNTSGLVVPHGTAIPSCQRLGENRYRRRVSRRYFCSFRLKMSPSGLIQASFKLHSGFLQADLSQTIGQEPPCKQGESGIGYADPYSPTHRPPAAGGPSSHRRGERGRPATAGVLAASMPLYAAALAATP